jgi:hypothetical protein
MRPPKVQRVLTGALVLLLGTLPSIATADTDLDGNGFADEREQFLIERFCPSLVLEANDQGVCPEPVEIVTNHMWASLYGGWEVGDHVYMGEVRDPSMDGANYSNIDNEHHGTFNPWRSYSNTLNCGEAHPVQYQLYHFDFGGRGQWCGEESRDHNDQPTEQTGDDWYTVYKNGNEWTEPGSAFPNTVYAHPFTYQDATDGGLTHVIQYWFFYPFDDWVNNHEGDWEHINVVITGDATTAQVKRVDYYFHETWFVANTTQTENPNSFDCYMIDETHPVIFVGGTWGADFDYYGIEASGSGPGSHGSYCMPGHWTGVQQMPHSMAGICR